MELPNDLKKEMKLLAPLPIDEYHVWKNGFDACYTLLAKTDKQDKELIERIKYALLTYKESKARTGVVLEECVEKLKQILGEK